MADPLEKLFGSQARVKLLRLFLFNSRHSFTLPEAAARARVKEREARREIGLFLKSGLVKKVRRPARAKGARFTLNDEFEYRSMLQQLLLNATERADDIYEALRRTGTIKLLVLSGVFTNEWEGRLDIFIVGDRVQERKLRERIRRLESEIGKELRYALLSSDEFLYRLNMNDHLVRDVLDYPHRIVADRFNIGLK
jgi:hypothetical protein